MAKSVPELQLAGIALDIHSPVPMYRQLYESLRQFILQGRLRAGERLPATRVLAQQLGVSRNTVLLAFECLWSEGYLQGRTGSGTYVTDSLPEHLLQNASTDGRLPNGPMQQVALSKRGQLLATLQVSATNIPEEIRPFQPGIPALDAFPFGLWNRLATRQLRLLPTVEYGYRDPCGYGPLRDAIAAHLRMTRAVQCEAEQVVIVNGSQQGLDLAARVLLDPKDSVWMEDPGYFGAKKAFVAAGLNLIPVPVDDEGLDVSYGEKHGPNARLACVTPSHQYPLGVVMSLPRRLQLLDWAHRRGGWILEDDYDSEFRYAGPPLSSLQGLDFCQRVIYLGTFSKVLFPALRLGYLVVPRDLVGAFAAAKALSDRHSAILEQAILSEFIAAGHFNRHVRRMRMLYQQRQQALIKAAQQLGGVLTIRPSEAGMHAVGWLAPGIDDQEVSRCGEQHGLTFPPLSIYSMRHRKPPGLVMGYAAFDEKELEAGVICLAELLAT